MRDWVSLAARLQRFEVVTIGIVLLVLLVAVVILTGQMQAMIGADPACFGAASAGGPQCPDVIDAFAGPDQIAEVLLRLVWLTPGIGIILGAPIVAREIESGTAQITWALANSRVRWLIGRSAPAAVAVIVALALLGIAADSLTQARLGGDPPGFIAFDQRGPIVVLRGLLALVLSVVIGMRLGRVLPALMLATVALVLVLAFIGLGIGSWRTSDAAIRPFGRGAVLPGSVVLDVVAVLADGSVVAEDRTDGLPEGSFTDAVLVLEPAQASSWMLREALVLVATSGAVSFAGLWRLSRRRPI